MQGCAPAPQAQWLATRSSTHSSTSIKGSPAARKTGEVAESANIVSSRDSSEAGLVASASMGPQAAQPAPRHAVVSLSSTLEASHRAPVHPLLVFC